MKDAGKTVTVRFRSIMMAAVMLVLLASCYSNEHELENTDGRVTLQPAVITGLQPMMNTRATFTVNSATGTYSDSYLGNGSEIRVYAVPVPDENTNEEQFDELKVGGSFTYNNDKWHSHVAVTAEHDYRVFGFAASAQKNANNPSASWLLPGASNQTFNWGLTNPANGYSAENFDMDNVAVNFTNMDVITSVDPLVCIASSFQKYNTEHPEQSVPVSTPALTKYTFQVARTEAEGNSSGLQFKVWMALDHLLAKATVSFSVDADYAEIRDIRLKEAKLVIDKSERSFKGNHSYSFKNGFIPDTHASFGNISNNNEDNLEIYLLGGEGNDAKTDMYDEGKLYSTLTTSYREFASFCFLPMSYLPDDGDDQTPPLEYPEVKLHVKYDIYKNDPDKEIPVRLNAEAENYFPLSSFKIGAGDPIAPDAGDHFRIKVKVSPTYLYQLHNEDGKIELTIEQ